MDVLHCWSYPTDAGIKGFPVSGKFPQRAHSRSQNEAPRSAEAGSGHFDETFHCSRAVLHAIRSMSTYGYIYHVCAIGERGVIDTATAPANCIVGGRSISRINFFLDSLPLDGCGAGIRPHLCLQARSITHLSCVLQDYLKLCGIPNFQICDYL